MTGNGPLKLFACKNRTSHEMYRHFNESSRKATASLAQSLVKSPPLLPRLRTYAHCTLAAQTGRSPVLHKSVRQLFLCRNSKPINDTGALVALPVVAVIHTSLEGHKMQDLFQIVFRFCPLPAYFFAICSAFIHDRWYEECDILLAPRTCSNRS